MKPSRTLNGSVPDRLIGGLWVTGRQMIDHTKKLVQERFTTANGYKYDAEVRYCKRLIFLVFHSCRKILVLKYQYLWALPDQICAEISWEPIVWTIDPLVILRNWWKATEAQTSWLKRHRRYPSLILCYHWYLYFSILDCLNCNWSWVRLLCCPTRLFMETQIRSWCSLDLLMFMKLWI